MLSSVSNLWKNFLNNLASWKALHDYNKKVARVNRTKAHFVAHPEKFVLFRGEMSTRKYGLHLALHFALDKEWARNFGDILLEGRLPRGCNIKLIQRADMEEGLSRRFKNEQQVWDMLFMRGYDALVGTDPIRGNIIDVVVHPKHRIHFKPQKINATSSIEEAVAGTTPLSPAVPQKM